MFSNLKKQDVFFHSKKTPSPFKKGSTSCNFYKKKLYWSASSALLAKAKEKEMGRPRNKEKTVFKQWNISLTEEEYNKLNDCYNGSGCRSKAQFMCEIVQYYSQISRIKELDDSVIDELLASRRLLNNIASNVNQVAKQVNVLGYAAEHEDIRESIEILKKEMDDSKKLAEKLMKKAYIILNK